MIRWVVGGDVREVFQQETERRPASAAGTLLWPAAEREPWKTPSSMTHTLVTRDL